MGLKYYADMNDAPVSDLLRQTSIKTENHLMDFSDASWQDFPDTGISIVEYMIFYQCEPIYHRTHVPGPVPQLSAESDYNAACNAWMALAHFRMSIHEFLNKNAHIISEYAPLIVLGSKFDMCMAKNDKDTKHKIHTTRIIHFARNGKSAIFTIFIGVR